MDAAVAARQRHRATKPVYRPTQAVRLVQIDETTRVDPAGPADIQHAAGRLLEPAVQIQPQVVRQQGIAKLQIGRSQCGTPAREADFATEAVALVNQADVAQTLESGPAIDLVVTHLDQVHDGIDVEVALADDAHAVEQLPGDADIGGTDVAVDLDLAGGIHYQVVARGGVAGNTVGGDGATAGADQLAVAGQQNVAFQQDRAGAGDAVAQGDGVGTAMDAIECTVCSHRATQRELACVQAQCVAIAIECAAETQAATRGRQGAGAECIHAAVECERARGGDVAEQECAGAGDDIQRLQRTGATHGTVERGRSAGIDGQLVVAVHRAVELDRAALQCRIAPQCHRGLVDLVGGGGDRAVQADAAGLRDQAARIDVAQPQRATADQCDVATIGADLVAEVVPGIGQRDVGGAGVEHGGAADRQGVAVAQIGGRGQHQVRAYAATDTPDAVAALPQGHTPQGGHAHHSLQRTGGLHDIVPCNADRIGFDVAAQHHVSGRTTIEHDGARLDATTGYLDRSRATARRRLREHCHRTGGDGRIIDRHRCRTVDGEAAVPRIDRIGDDGAAGIDAGAGKARPHQCVHVDAARSENAGLVDAGAGGRAGHRRQEAQLRHSRGRHAIGDQGGAGRDQVDAAIARREDAGIGYRSTDQTDAAGRGAQGPAVVADHGARAAAKQLERGRNAIGIKQPGRAGQQRAGQQAAYVHSGAGSEGDAGRVDQEDLAVGGQ